MRAAAAAAADCLLRAAAPGERGVSEGSKVMSLTHRTQVYRNRLLAGAARTGGGASASLSALSEGRERFRCSVGHLLEWAVFQGAVAQ